MEETHVLNTLLGGEKETDYILLL